jgi:ABC-type multidrug transport system fused ATPase/permease subunit
MYLYYGGTDQTRLNLNLANNTKVKAGWNHIQVPLSACTSNNSATDTVKISAFTKVKFNKQEKTQTGTYYFSDIKMVDANVYTSVEESVYDATALNYMIFSNLNTLEDSFVASSRLFDFIDQVEDKYIGYNKTPSFKGDVEFKNITFSYDQVNPVLKNVSFKVNAGEFIGLAGHTGSGKTTIMTLLQRFYDLEQGQILIDNIDFMNYTKQ